MTDEAAGGALDNVDRPPMLSGVLVTYRRPDDLAAMLDALAAQQRPLDRLVVVDNDPSPESRALVAQRAPAAEYVAAPGNLGPAGGIAVGMGLLLVGATDDDWIVTLDDDDPPGPTVFAELADFAHRARTRDPRVGAVGASGVRFDRRRGRVIRIPDEELDGPVPVDSIGGNRWPTYSVRAIRAVGTFRSELFFGPEGPEFGLRLADAGFVLLSLGPMQHRMRVERGRLAIDYKPSFAVSHVDWRRYYSLRNLVRILCLRRAVFGALYVTVVVGIGKPVVNLVRDPRVALENLRWNLRALRDGWSGRMGRTVEPG